MGKDAAASIDIFAAPVGAALFAMNGLEALTRWIPLNQGARCS